MRVCVASVRVLDFICPFPPNNKICDAHIRSHSMHVLDLYCMKTPPMRGVCKPLLLVRVLSKADRLSKKVEVLCSWGSNVVAVVEVGG